MCIYACRTKMLMGKLGQSVHNGAYNLSSNYSYRLCVNGTWSPKAALLVSLRHKHVSHPRAPTARVSRTLAARVLTCHYLIVLCNPSNLSPTTPNQLGVSILPPLPHPVNPMHSKQHYPQRCSSSPSSSAWSPACFSARLRLPPSPMQLLQPRTPL
jgi:hypothetical protein